jgi:hypothetical protein
VHQKHRRPAAAGNGNYAGTAGFDFGSLETFEEHGLTYRAVMVGHSRSKGRRPGHPRLASSEFKTWMPAT